MYIDFWVGSGLREWSELAAAKLSSVAGGEGGVSIGGRIHKPTVPTARFVAMKEAALE